MDSKLHKFSFRQLMREFARRLKMPWIRFLITITSKLFALLSPNIFITYDHSAKPDGVGAQIQRVLGIYSLGNSI
jgi:hypothetical protein